MTLVGGPQRRRDLQSPLDTGSIQKEETQGLL